MKKLLVLLMMLSMILMVSSCKTISTPTHVLFTEFDSPPSRPIVAPISEGTDVLEALKLTGIYLARSLATIERWEEHQKREDGYYTLVYIETK